MQNIAYSGTLFSVPSLPNCRAETRMAKGACDSLAYLRRLSERTLVPDFTSMGSTAPSGVVVTNSTSPEASPGVQ